MTQDINTIPHVSNFVCKNTKIHTNPVTKDVNIIPTHICM